MWKNLVKTRFFQCLLLCFLMCMTVVRSKNVHIWKCCLKGEHLHTNGRDCAANPNSIVDPFMNIHNESTQEIQLSRPNDLYWLPKKLWERNLSVHYAEVFQCNKFRVVNFDDNRLSVDDNMNITLRISKDEKIEFEPADYCIDASARTPGSPVARICVYGLLPGDTLLIPDQIDKCCPQGQLITEERGQARCTENLNVTMNGPPGLIKMNRDSKYGYNSHSLCTTGEFQILKWTNLTERMMEILLQGTPIPADGAIWRHTCLDARLSPEHSLNWTIGYCSFSFPSFAALNAAQFLSAPAAALLALVVVAVVADPMQRASTHGRALACHAGSLCVAHATHAVYVFTGQEYCRVAALVINFFFLAAVFWLQIICFNMAQAFRKMLRTNAGNEKSKKIRKFIYFSIYGWGFPLIFTAVVLGIETEYQFSGPLYHTKTCYFEEGPMSRVRKVNTLLYYYISISIILILNIGMFVYVAVRIRAARRETSILYRKEDGRPSSTRKSAVMYVKLLLLMGVVEMAVDVGAWAIKNSNAPIEDGVRLTDKFIVYSIVVKREFTYRWIAHSMDLLRAVVIFVVCCFGEATRKKLRHKFGECRVRLCGLAPKKETNTDEGKSTAKSALSKMLKFTICPRKCCAGSNFEIPESASQGIYTSSRASIDTITSIVSLESRKTSSTSSDIDINSYPSADREEIELK